MPDDLIKGEINKIYQDFMAVTDPQIAAALAQQAAQRRP
jgi:hypothetical protein